MWRTLISSSPSTQRVRRADGVNRTTDATVSSSSRTDVSAGTTRSLDDTMKTLSDFERSIAEKRDACYERAKMLWLGGSKKSAKQQLVKAHRYQKQCDATTAQRELIERQLDMREQTVIHTQVKKALTQFNTAHQKELEYCNVEEVEAQIDAAAENTQSFDELNAAFAQTYDDACDEDDLVRELDMLVAQGRSELPQLKADDRSNTVELLPSAPRHSTKLMHSPGAAVYSQIRMSAPAT